MAPFNWFTRKSDATPAASPPEAKETEKPQAEADGDRPDSGDDTEKSAVDEDYLSWAKVAYQNIQKQKAAQTEPEPEPSSSEAATESSEPASDNRTSESESSAQVAPEESQKLSPEEVGEEADETDIENNIPETVAEVEPSSESLSPAAEETTDVVSSTAGRSEATPDEPPHKATPDELSHEDSSGDAVEVSALDGAIPEGTASDSTLPFWAKAETERLDRLERLKATAMEEVEPESPSPPDSSDLVSDEGFDDNFIWSAGVLAAQGRRPEDISVEEITWLKRLRQGLGKTRRSLINQLRGIVGQGPLNQDAVMEIEALLLQADVGIEATDYVIDALQQRLRQEALPPEEAISYLKEILRKMLDQPYEKDYEQAFAPEKDTLNIWLMTGVNGAGKTTTIGKLAHLARKSEYSCLIAAADTFRAAAVEQVKIWGQRSSVDVISNPGKNTDPAAVVYDGIEAAKSRHTELLLVDTAGRLQNKKNLMDELSKIRRIVDKKAPDAKVESLLVLDATLGQNGLRQAEVFSEAASLSGVVLTKLDGTAKGGVALAVVKQLGLPIRFIGAGEGIEDLRPFSSYEFVEALLSG